MNEIKKPENPNAFPKSMNEFGYDGMTLRDYFANSAMQGIVSLLEKDVEVIYYDKIAIDSYVLADAMLKQREQ